MSDVADTHPGPTASTGRPLSPTARKFVREWGDLANRWGADRTTAEIHALLYVSPVPMNDRTVADTLTLRVDETSTGLEALREMGVVRAVGRRPDAVTYECLPDVWEMFHAILEERRRREVEPAVGVLRDAVLRADSDAACDPYTVRRLEEMQAFLRDALGLYKQLSALSGPQVHKLFKIGGKIRRALGASD